MTELTLAQLAEWLGGELTGDGACIARGVGPIEDAREDEVTFLANSRYERFAATTGAAAIIVGADYDGAGRNVIRCADPYHAFRQTMVRFYGFRQAEFEGAGRCDEGIGHVEVPGHRQPDTGRTARPDDGER